MAIAQFEKLHLLVHHSRLKEVIADIQALGFCEPITRDESSGPVLLTRPQEANLDQLQGDVKYLLRSLGPHFKPSGGLERFLSPKPSCSLTSLRSVLAAEEVSSLAQQMKAYERQIADIRSRETSGRATRDVLEKLSDMPYPLSLFTMGTSHVTAVIGSITTAQVDNFKASLNSIGSNQKEVYIVENGSGKESFVAIVYARAIGKEIQEVITQYGFAKIDLDPQLAGEVHEEKAKIDVLLRDLSNELEVILEETKDLASRWVPKLQLLSDYISILSDQLSAVNSGEATEKIAIYSFWVPVFERDKLKKTLIKHERYISFDFSDPDENDRPPVLLTNKGFAEVYEPLTNLYGSPAYGSIDPTALMAPFFFLFFGMCLGDGGYGMLLAVLFFGAIRKYGMIGESKKFFSILGYGGIAAILVGIATGSWLGDMIDLFPFFEFLAPLKNAPAFLDPLNDPITFLIISLALGVMQILYGLSAAMVHNLRQGDPIAAFADQGGWIVLIVGLLLFGGGTADVVGPPIALVGKIMTWAGAIILVATQGRHKPTLVGKALSGVLSLYNITSYLGDVLSYSRLLALGLASSAVAMIINMLADLLGGVPYVGWIFGALIFLGGHLFNLAIGVLGAFVHSLRLQYVEFFSKFYISGGRAFAPLRYRTEHVTISDGVK
ncbi:MAG: V-type ATP synthase subunit I [Synergistaceae bacterium]|nr:V-type ATP synthase subunit I [Synergistaceae bacterium]